MINVLVVMNQDVRGCVFYRQVVPHTYLHQREDFDITLTDNVAEMSDEKLKKFQIVQFHKGYVSLESNERLQKLGKKTIIDFDDYWWIPRSHMLYNQYYCELKEKEGKTYIDTSKKRKYSTTDFYKDMLTQFDYVTVTTPLLAEQVKPFNKNVEVFENAIDYTMPQFQIKNNPYPKMRFGWIGGTCHLTDISLLQGLGNKLGNNIQLRDKYELRLFGYVKGTEYDKFVDILTDNRRYLDNFRAFKQTSVWDYTRYYNDLDVVLIPLVEDKFNSMKSELKLVEAATFKKPVIVSDVYPYKPFLEHKKNCLVIRHKEWDKKIKYCLNNPEHLKDMGEQLHFDLKYQFDIKTVTENRADFYQKILE